MCCDYIRCHIICRVLHRGKGINIFAVRKNDNPSRVLSRTSSDSRTPFHNSLNLTFSLSAVSLLIIIFHKTICRLICKSTDCSRTESLACSENHFRIFMSITLIIAREIQVDIRLFIPLKSKKRLKRNIKPVFCKGFPTYRTFFIRHIPARQAGIRPHFVRCKITVMTFFTIIMRT